MKHLKLLYNHAASSFMIFIKNPLFILSSFFADLLLFLIFSFVYSFFSTGIMERIIEVNDIMAGLNQQLVTITQGIEDNAALSAVMAGQQVIVEHVKEIVILAIGLMISTYILWSIFQGISWHLASWAAYGKKIHFLKYLGRFSLLSLVWFIALALIGYATYKVSVYNELSRFMIIGQETINYLMLFLVAVMFYFAVISYSFAAKNSFLISLKNAFVFGIRRIHHYLPTYLSIALLLVIIYFAISLLNLDLIKTVFLNLLLMLPVFAYGRVLFLGMSDRSEKGKPEKVKSKKK